MIASAVGTRINAPTNISDVNVWRQSPNPVQQQQQQQQHQQIAMDQNYNFFMFQYKVKACPHRKQCPANRKVSCAGYHHERERRRNTGPPPNFLYSDEPCPNVKVIGSGKWNVPSSCAESDGCKFSHTLLEQMYHPNIYKTSMCINYINPDGNKCQWRQFCTHAHGHQDMRTTNKSNLKKNRNKHKNSNNNNHNHNNNNNNNNNNKNKNNNNNSNSKHNRNNNNNNNNSGGKNSQHQTQHRNNGNQKPNRNASPNPNPNHIKISIHHRKNHNHNEYTQPQSQTNDNRIQRSQSFGGAELQQHPKQRGLNVYTPPFVPFDQQLHALGVSPIKSSTGFPKYQPQHFSTPPISMMQHSSMQQQQQRFRLLAPFTLTQPYPMSHDVNPHEVNHHAMQPQPQPQQQHMHLRHQPLPQHQHQHQHQPPPPAPAHQSLSQSHSPIYMSQRAHAPSHELPQIHGLVASSAMLPPPSSHVAIHVPRVTPLHTLMAEHNQHEQNEMGMRHSHQIPGLDGAGAGAGAGGAPAKYMQVQNELGHDMHYQDPFVFTNVPQNPSRTRRTRSCEALPYKYVPQLADYISPLSTQVSDFETNQSSLALQPSIPMQMPMQMPMPMPLPMPPVLKARLTNETMGNTVASPNNTHTSTSGGMTVSSDISSSARTPPPPKAQDLVSRQIHDSSGLHSVMMSPKTLKSIVNKVVFVSRGSVRYDLNQSDTPMASQHDHRRNHNNYPAPNEQLVHNRNSTEREERRPTRDRRANTVPDIYSSLYQKKVSHNVYTELGLHITSPTEQRLIPNSWFTGVDFTQKPASNRKSEQQSSVANPEDVLLQMRGGSLNDLPHTPSPPPTEIELLRQELADVKLENNQLKEALPTLNNSKESYTFTEMAGNRLSHTAVDVEHDEHDEDDRKHDNEANVSRVNPMHNVIGVIPGMSRMDSNDKSKSGTVEHSDEEFDVQMIKGKLQRYAQILLCPCCRTSENNRNQVLIPCGHLICDACVLNQVKCILCSTPIEQTQLLLIDS